MEQSSQSFLSTIFINPTERRLRAGWRLLIQLLLLVIITIALSIPVIFLDPASPYTNLVSSLVAALAVTISVFISRRLLDRRTISSLGLRWDRFALPDLLVGTGLMGLVMGAIFLTHTSFGWLQLGSPVWQTQPASTVIGSLLLALVWFILVGWQEELFVRGYQLQNLADGLNLTWGVLISSSIFSFYHLLNPHASWVSFLGIWIAGIFLAYGYLRTRQLWLPIGLHIGWNLFEGPVFGFPVSGMSVPGLLQHTVTGPELWTGGQFGPEAGLILLPAMLLGAALVYLYTQRRVLPDQVHQPKTKL